MSDVATIEPDPPAAPACANCSAPLHGPFCAQCGQAVKPLDPPVRHFAKEFGQELFDLDNRVLRSLRRLVFSPGFLTREYLAGRRIAWLSPLRLYLLTSVAAFAAIAFADTDAGLRIAVTGRGGQPVDVRGTGYASGAELAAALDTAREVWIPRVMFVMVPLFGWLVSRVRRSAGRHYPAHLAFALHVFAAGFAVRAVVTVLGLALPPSASRWFDAIVQLYSIAYLYLALRSTYGGTRLRAVRDVVLVGVVFLVALLLVSGVVVLTAVLGSGWLRMLGR